MITAKNAKEIASKSSSNGFVENSDDLLFHSFSYMSITETMSVDQLVDHVISKAASDGKESVYLFCKNLEDRDFAISLLKENGYHVRNDPSSNSCSIYVKWETLWN